MGASRNSIVGIDRQVYMKKGERKRHPVPLDSPWFAAIPEVCVLCWEQTAMDWRYVDVGLRKHVVHTMCEALAMSRLAEARH